MLMYYEDPQIPTISALQSQILQTLISLLGESAGAIQGEKLELYKDDFYILPFLPTHQMVKDGDEVTVRMQGAKSLPKVQEPTPEVKMEVSQEALNRVSQDIQKCLSRGKLKSNWYMC